MRNRFTGLIGVMGAVLLLPPVMVGQTAQQSGTSRTTPDLSGFWSRSGGPGFQITGPDGKPVIAPMQPWAEETFKALRRAEETEPVPNHWLDSRGRNRFEMAVDPSWVGCVPMGFPRLYFSGGTFEIYQLPGRVIQIFESDRMARIIYTDGRGHPEGLPNSFLGHSIGRWDGDTLVVDTIGLREADETWLDGDGHPKTEALHVTERLRRVKQDALEVELLFDDPKAYTKPWGGKIVFSLRQGWELMEFHRCEERIGEEIVPEVRRVIKELSAP